MPPIEITDQQIVIPQRYMDTEFSVELIGDKFVFRPKTNGKNGHAEVNSHAVQAEQYSDAEKLSYEEKLAKVRERFPWAGTWDTGEPNLSMRVEEILAAEIDPRSGWTTKPPLEENE